MDNLLKNLKTLLPEVDYQALMAEMRGNSHPRRKLKELQDKGILTRLKKGFYIFSEDFIGRSYSPQIVANLLYGPSYLSLEYALSYHRLIPERVEAFTSVTTQKNKNFQTAAGHFSYKHLATSLYPVGVSLQKTEDGRSFLIATPEKALMDIFSLKFKNSDKPVKKDIPVALYEDLRIERDVLLKNLNRSLLQEMKPYYQSRRWNDLVIKHLLESS